MKERTVVPIAYKELPGLTEKQLAEHHDVLYAGYVKKTNEIRAAVKTVDLAKTNATYSDLRELKLEEGFAVNGVVLHEQYFASMTPGGNADASVVRQWIEQDFGSFEAWQNEFAALGMASRGWVVLAFDLNDGMVHNYLADAHNQGGVWGAIPLLVLDVYEHAYFLDYATARKKYIETFMANLDWSAATAAAVRFDLAKYRV